MKTTVDIPDALYKKAKIRAIERGVTLKEIVLRSLTKELEAQDVNLAEGLSFSERRHLLPAYEAALESGAFSGGTDSAQLLSEDRSSRDDALL